MPERQGCDMRHCAQNYNMDDINTMTVACVSTVCISTQHRAWPRLRHCAGWSSGHVGSSFASCRHPCLLYAGCRSATSGANVPHMCRWDSFSPGLQAEGCLIDDWAWRCCCHLLILCRSTIHCLIPVCYSEPCCGRVCGAVSLGDFVCYKEMQWLGMHKQAGTRAGNCCDMS